MKTWTRNNRNTEGVYGGKKATTHGKGGEEKRRLYTGMEKKFSRWQKNIHNKIKTKKIKKK